MAHLATLLDEIKQLLYSMVPTRRDIHHAINDDFGDEITWDFQHKLVKWVEKFQAPIYDQMTIQWKRNLPEKLSDFLKKYYEHVKKLRKDIDEYNTPATGKNGVPDRMSSGK